MSANSKRSPAPWHLERDLVPGMQQNWSIEHGRSEYVLAADRETVVARLYTGAGKSDTDAHHAQVIADGRLIAAAPDLLEALKAVLASPNAEEDEPAREAARAAIAKAEGRP